MIEAYSLKKNSFRKWFKLKKFLYRLGVGHTLIFKGSDRYHLHQSWFLKPQKKPLHPPHLLVAGPLIKELFCGITIMK